MIMKVRLKDFGLKSSGCSSNLSGSLHCAPGARPEASGIRYLVWKQSLPALSEESVGSPSLVCPRASALSLRPAQAASSLPPVSELPPEGNCTGCCKRESELNEAPEESGGPAVPFLTC